MKTFLFLNLWAFVLDLIVSLIVIITVLIMPPVIIRTLLALVSLIILAKAIELHVSVKRKHRARTILIEKNRILFKEESFEQFMGAPCGRMLVRDVLDVLGRQAEYQLLEKRYYKGFFAGTKSELVIIPYKEKEDTNL